MQQEVKELGFSTVAENKGYTLKMKGVVVATGLLMEEDENDVCDYYKKVEVVIRGDRVVVKGQKITCSFERGGTTNQGVEAFLAGTLDASKKFTKAKSYTRLFD